MDVISALRTGRLTVIDDAVTLADGWFDPAPCCRVWRSQREDTKAPSRSSTQTWASSACRGVETLVGHETALNDLVIDGFAGVVCQYDARPFDPAQLCAVRMAHPASTQPGVDESSLRTP
ncbi:MEDS domain-containing protein [Dactylosporangium sp. CS-047395]|uniref:MEDS domain-containing protein n=1 Tax=Dactylosporangium sp. CS-047395 TaxID=3239936 RepID=UPI003D8BE5FE